MKISFFHDARLIKDADDKYYSIGFSYSIWKRYLRIFDDLLIATRVTTNTNKKNISELGYRLSSGKHVSFSPIYSYKNLKSFLLNYRDIKEEIRNVLLSTDGAIIRLPSVIGILACREAIKLDKKFIIETVGCSWDSMWNYGSIISKLIAGPMYLLQKKYTKKAPYVIYITNEFLQRRYPSNGITKDGVANVMIAPPSNELIEKRIYKIKNMNKNNISIGLIGSLNVDYKGHKIAIKALSYLKSKGINAELFFVGDGDQSRWRKLAKKQCVIDKVHFVGTLASGEEIYSWLDKMDFYIQPSKAEGHGRALVEAVSRGCICFGSNRGGIPDTLHKEYLFSPKDYKRLAKLIMKAINNPDFAIQNIKRNAKKISSFEHDIIQKKRDSILLEFRNSLNHNNCNNYNNYRKKFYFIGKRDSNEGKNI